MNKTDLDFDGLTSRFMEVILIVSIAVIFTSGMYVARLIA